MKPFYSQRPFLAWVIAIIGIAMCACLLFLWIRLVDGSFVWVLGIFVVVPVIQFMVTPLFTLVGFYTYFSPMVVSFGASGSMIDLHNGSSFDYLLEMRGISPGAAFKTRMLQHYLRGLLEIVSQVEIGRLPSTVVVRGSSYFLSQRSASRLGFEVSTTSVAEKVNLALNYVDLVWMYSLSNGRFTLPRLQSTSTVRSTGEILMHRKESIAALAQLIARRG